jgi:hypothetical protein
MTVIVLSEIVDDISAAISNLVQAVKKLDALAASTHDSSKLHEIKHVKNSVHEAIDDIIRKYSDNMPHRVSKQADILARQNDPELDLHIKTYRDRNKVNRDRKLFNEHMTPVSKIRKLCLEAPNAATRADILNTHLCVVWVTKEENQRLNNNGHRTHRPDPAAAYLQAGIELLADPLAV